MQTQQPPRATREEAIRAEKVAKRFKARHGDIHALREVSFSVERGTVFTILGPNGAGKTTLLRILTTIMRPTSGDIWIEGHHGGHDNIRIRQLIGIVAQDNHFDKYLTAWQNLTLHARMHGMEKAAYEARVTELLHTVELYDRRHDYLDDFSGGMQRRIALIRALIHKPRLLFLDEPTTGLDPAARLEIWQIIQEIKEQTTVILTTHYMEEADRLSDQIMILNHGQIVMTGTAPELKQRIAPPETYELLLNHGRAHEYPARLSAYVREIEVVDRNILRFRLDTPDQLASVIAQLAPSDLQQVGLAQVDLETVYLQVAGQRKETP